MARAQPDNLHSRLVGVLKVLLPLLALAILSTLFLVSRKINPEDAIPYADVDIEDRLRDPKMTGAALAGMTRDGSALTLSAAVAKPGAGAGGSLSQVTGSLQTPDGRANALAAAMVQADPDSHLILLSGGAEFADTQGWTVTTEGLRIATDRTRVESTGPVGITGPIGQLTADHMTFHRPGGTSGPYVLVFNGQVRLLYEAQK